MPCWVAPVVAAELWGVSPGHVLAAIADGSLPSRREYGFVVVDVAPDGTAPVVNGPREGPPPTYTVVSVDGPEVIAAAEVPATPEPEPTVHLPEPQWAPPVVDGGTSEELPPLCEEEDDKPISDWRQVRSSVGRTRKPPVRVAPSASAA